MLNAPLFLVKMVQGNQQLPVRSVMGVIEWNFLIKMVILLEMTVQIFMFLMSGLLVKIFE